jgi:hypothetical protein
MGQEKSMRHSAVALVVLHLMLALVANAAGNARLYQFDTYVMNNEGWMQTMTIL